MESQDPNAARLESYAYNFFPCNKGQGDKSFYMCLGQPPGALAHPL